MSRPSAGLIETLQKVQGDVIVLGVGGKMGPTLARMAKRAAIASGDNRKIFGASRFSSPRLPAQLRSHGIEPIMVDLLDRAQLAQLPDAPNVIYMAGMKFGGTGHESMT